MKQGTNKLADNIHIHNIRKVRAPTVEELAMARRIEELEGKIGRLSAIVPNIDRQFLACEGALRRQVMRVQEEIYSWGPEDVDTPGRSGRY